VNRKREGIRALLEQAEEELRRAHMAHRAGVKGSAQRLMQAEREAEKWRRRMAILNGAVDRDFGPGALP